jgi:predicted dithiol-disulfide oxidoreductase (DUF899 family)
MPDHEVVSREEWAAVRAELLAREKEHTRLGDELARQRRELPWLRLDKEYVLETVDGTYKRRMGWKMPWASAADSDFNFDLRYSRTEEQAREAFAPMLEAGVPPVLDHNATSSGTDVAGYLTQGPGFSAFVLDDGAVYQTYATTARGLEFLMGYYPILERTPKGRDEGDASQMWIRRHDEY